MPGITQWSPSGLCCFTSPSSSAAGDASFLQRVAAVALHLQQRGTAVAALTLQVQQWRCSCSTRGFMPLSFELIGKST
jgi:hypothetical protein